MEEKIVLPVGHCVSLHRFPFGGCASRSAACATLVEERRLRRQERRRHHREQRRQAVVVPGNVGKHLDFPHANLCRNENSPFGDSNAPRLIFLHTLIFRFFFFFSRHHNSNIFPTIFRRPSLGGPFFHTSFWRFFFAHSGLLKKVEREKKN